MAGWSTPAPENTQSRELRRRSSKSGKKLTLGSLIEAIEEALNKSVVPKLQEIVDALLRN
jgi:hypothetical protein